MRRRTMPRRREDPKPQLSYFTKSDGKLARVCTRFEFCEFRKQSRL